MMPELRLFVSLTIADFERSPVWIRVRSFDRAAPWYDEANEETFRSWDQNLPFRAERGIALVVASLRFKDGSVHTGFVTPARNDWDTQSPQSKIGARSIRSASPSARHGGSQLAILGIQQPHIFLGPKVFGFWGGRLGVSEEVRKDFYHTTGRSPGEIFPIHFDSDSNLSNGILSGVVEGFYKSVPGSTPERFW